MNMETFYNGLTVSLYGLGGVFIVLILFYILTKGMVLLAKRLPAEEEDIE